MFVLYICILALILFLVVHYFRSQKTDITELNYPNEAAINQIMQEDFQTIYYGSIWTDANLIATKLDEEGIETFLSDENAISADPLASYQVGGVKVKVRTEDYEMAKKILNEFYEAEITCSYCDSSNTIRYIKFGEKYNDQMTGIPDLGPSSQKANLSKYRCNDCGRDFES